MKAENIIIKEKYKGLKNLVLICEAMDEFAEAYHKQKQMKAEEYYNKWSEPKQMNEYDVDFYEEIRRKLLIRGFSVKTIQNNRGIISATIDETILKIIKNQNK